MLSGVKEFFVSLDDNDMVIFLTSRTFDMKDQTEEFLKTNGIRFNHIIYSALFGEKIIMNDNKPSGLEMSKALCLTKDAGIHMDLKIDNML